MVIVRSVHKDPRVFLRCVLLPAFITALVTTLLSVPTATADPEWSLVDENELSQEELSEFEPMSAPENLEARAPQAGEIPEPMLREWMCSPWGAR